MVLSSCEAEYVTASYVACQVAWIEMLLKELKIMESKIIKLFVDNKLAIDMENHPASHGRSKHIEMICHFLRDQTHEERRNDN